MSFLFLEYSVKKAILQTVFQNFPSWYAVFSDRLESWQKWLVQMANNLENCREEVYEKKNEYHDEYVKQFDNWSYSKDKNGNTILNDGINAELSKKYHNRNFELYKESEQLLQQTMTLLGRYLRNIWD